GDQQQRLLAVTNSRTVADADAGSEGFQRLRDGNGTFSVAADAGNTGSAALKSARVVDAALWDGGSYTLSFSAGNYEIRDGGNAVVTSGAYAAGQNLSFRGIDLGLSGTPADGDRFTVGASAQRDLFAQVEELARIAESPIDTEAQRAVLQTRVFQS
ncbi:UNVERIFIED_CONTAM: flagellar biosynthesis protein FlgL, partial [Salmonella enterica subsp. enterica serovar Weltevreden]